VNAERCALLGSAYKRLATVLRDWSVPGSAEQPQSIRAALEQSAQWYQHGEGDPQRPGFSAYNCQNRLVLQAVLGIARPADAQLAIRAGEIAANRYAQSRDYFDAIMLADGWLIARLIDGSLQQPNAMDARAVEQEIVAHYQSVRAKLPETARWFDSVLAQIKLLAYFYQVQEESQEGRHAQVVERLRRIAAALEETELTPARDRKAIRRADVAPAAQTSRGAPGAKAPYDEMMQHDRDGSWKDVVRVAEESLPSKLAQTPEQQPARGVEERDADDA
jgi:hypothetical protein